MIKVALISVIILNYLSQSEHPSEKLQQQLPFVHPVQIVNHFIVG